MRVAVRIQSVRVRANLVGTLDDEGEGVAEREDDYKERRREGEKSVFLRDEDEGK